MRRDRSWDDILAIEAAPEEVLPNGGMIVWLKKDAEITHRRALTAKIQAQNLVEVRQGRLLIRMRHRSRGLTITPAKPAK